MKKMLQRGRFAGVLVLAGILERDFDGVSAAYAELGFSEIERFTDREWTGGVFRS